MTTIEEILELPIHPAAAVFPMLPDDELDELAADIKANGLRQPIIVQAGVLIDGRNRREACKRAGVSPVIQELEGKADPVAFIISSNVNRRHMTKGQRAMAVAMIRPDAEHGGPRKRGASSETKLDGLSATRISYARAVLKWAADLADGVLNGATGLDAAYETATQRKNAAEGPAARLETLRAKAPDLADQVIEEKLQLAEAEAALRARRETERAQRQAIYDFLRDLEGALCIIARPQERAQLIEILHSHGEEIDATATMALLENWSKALAAFFEQEKSE